MSWPRGIRRTTEGHRCRASSSSRGRVSWRNSRVSLAGGGHRTNVARRAIERGRLPDMARDAVGHRDLAHKTSSRAVHGFTVTTLARRSHDASSVVDAEPVIAHDSPGDQLGVTGDADPATHRPAGAFKSTPPIEEGSIRVTTSTRELRGPCDAKLHRSQAIPE